MTLLVLAGCSAASEPPGDAPPIRAGAIAQRHFGDPVCSRDAQTRPWPNPFNNYPSTLPFYGDGGAIPVRGAIDGVDVPASVWFEQRLWTLMGMGPDDPDSTVASHPSTVPGYTWRAVQGVPAAGYTQADFENLLHAFADVDPVDSSVPQCGYGMAVNIAWDPNGGGCDTCQ